MSKILFVLIFVAGSLALIYYAGRRRSVKNRKTRVRYSQSYESLATYIAETAETKLGRRLDETEQNAIRRAPSLMTLEMFALRVEHSTTPADVENELFEFSNSYESDLFDAKSQINIELTEFLGRPLSPDELRAIENIPNMSEAMKWLDDIKDEIVDIMPSN